MIQIMTHEPVYIHNGLSVVSTNRRTIVLRRRVSGWKGSNKEDCVIVLTICADLTRRSPIWVAVMVWNGSDDN